MTASLLPWLQPVHLLLPLRVSHGTEVPRRMRRQEELYSTSRLSLPLVDRLLLVWGRAQAVVDTGVRFAVDEACLVSEPTWPWRRHTGVTRVSQFLMSGMFHPLGSTEQLSSLPPSLGAFEAPSFHRGAPSG